MRAIVITTALAALALGCRTPPEPVAAIELDEPARIAAAGRGNVRAAYTAFALSLFDLNLSLLETMPAGWFPGTAEFDEGMAQVAEVTGHAPAPGADLHDFGQFVAHARVWRAWYVERRPQMHESRQAHLDALFGRLEGTSPFLTSDEFRDAIQTVAGLSGLRSSWEGPGGEERYARWADFSQDRATWRRWFDEQVDQLEYDPETGRLVVGRGLPGTE